MSGESHACLLRLKVCHKSASVAMPYAPHEREPTSSSANTGVQVWACPTQRRRRPLCTAAWMMASRSACEVGVKLWGICSLGEVPAQFCMQGSGQTLSGWAQ